MVSAGTCSYDGGDAENAQSRRRITLAFEPHRPRRRALAPDAECDALTLAQPQRGPRLCRDHQPLTVDLDDPIANTEPRARSLAPLGDPADLDRAPIIDDLNRDAESA